MAARATVGIGKFSICAALVTRARKGRSAGRGARRYAREFHGTISPRESLDWTRTALRLLPPDTEPSIEAALWLGVARTAEILPAHDMRVAADRAVALARTVGDLRLLCDTLGALILILGSHYPEEQTLA